MHPQEIHWLKQNIPISEDKKFLLDHRVLVVKSYSDNTSDIVYYDVFCVASAEPEDNNGEIKHITNKYWDPNTQQYVIQNGDKYACNEPIYPNDLNNLPHQSYVNCKFSFNIPNEWIDENVVGTVSPKQLEYYKELNNYREPSIELVRDERVQEHLNDSKYINRIEFDRNDFINDTNIDGIHFIVCLHKNNLDIEDWEEDEKGYTGVVYAQLDKLYRFKLYVNLVENYIYVNDQHKNFEFDYNIGTQELEIYYNKFDTDFVYSVIEAIIETLNEII